ncbi:hypothetical protein BD770DRAFT_391146 [Pilaira anomala]|nr:hypothetical protein BD770DRAFT_391146 [Pilaira anomala]
MSNPNDQFEADLQAIETAMSSMMQGAFSSLFKELVDTAFDHSSITTTIIDGNNIHTKKIVDGKTIIDDNRDIHDTTASITIEDEFGGNDFKRLRNKSKQNRGLISSSSSLPSENISSMDRIQAYNQQHSNTQSEEKPYFFQNLFSHLFNKKD